MDKPKPPSHATLQKYGLTEAEWWLILYRQHGVCPICGRSEGIRFVIDHQHIPGWAHKTPAERRKYVRGLVCVHDNHRLLGRFMTATKALRIHSYLREYEKRRDADLYH